MVSRCRSEQTVLYKRYGAKGIKLDWESFEHFSSEMYQSYVEHVLEYGIKETTIDRIDSSLGYHKNNCRWATKKEQYETIKHK